ncbi:alkyl hydroperoxide reductase subunit F [Aestuariibacter salexigens]|uniref:alkyl hydroperoxide reductase subunit F n=1 Tax=Aestuariibacter salexigens TaxID=226010 RepID=UPI000414BD75|nr:alkyl hydroperoxide reductase subunit F [Aestuariibacter salexigens]
MLTNDILQALKQYTANMQSPVTLVLQQDDGQSNQEKRQELKSFLEQVAGVSDNLNVVEPDKYALRSGLSFTLEVNGEPTGIVFSGIPGGHEFNSFVLALLQAAGTPIKLDSTLQNMIKAVDKPLSFEVYISLSCHNCPDVVQALNQFALLNPHIKTEMIDGGLFPELVEQNNIQGVPTVILNGEVFANGKVDTAQLIDKLKQAHPDLGKQAAPTEALPEQDVTVIGGGPAGVAAAIYAARKGLKVTIVADRFGGQVKDTMDIENLISVPKTTGTELTGALHTHLADYDVTIKEHMRVEQIKKGDVKTLVLSSGEEITSKTVIIATGAKWRELGVPGEKENVGNGVAYCPHCDGPFYKGKDVAVIGGGNSGVEAALDLAGIVKSVTVMEFMPELKADKVLVDKLYQRENVSVLTNVATQQITASNGKVDGIEYQDRETSDTQRVDLQGVFVQIGLLPNSQGLDGVVELTKYGEVVINEKGETSEPGIFACGDVTTVPYKQIVIAMGEGAKASLAAFDYLIKHFN